MLPLVPISTIWPPIADSLVPLFAFFLAIRHTALFPILPLKPTFYGVMPMMVSFAWVSALLSLPMLGGIEVSGFPASNGRRPVLALGSLASECHPLRSPTARLSCLLFAEAPHCSPF